MCGSCLCSVNNINIATVNLFIDSDTNVLVIFTLVVIQEDIIVLMFF